MPVARRCEPAPHGVELLELELDGLCARRHAAIRVALKTMRSMRRASVSMPCMIRKALKGDSTAPRLRRGTAAQRAAKARSP